MTIAPYRKAVVAGLVAALTALGTALADGGVTGPEGGGAIIAGLLAALATYSVPNSKPPMEFTEDASGRFGRERDFDSFGDS